MSDAFHDHLDTCAQCRENPFNLCAEGQKIITGAAETLLTLTGRPVSEPRLQTIPMPKTELGDTLRASFKRAFYDVGDGGPLVEFDYSKLEERVACVLCEHGVPKSEAHIKYTDNGYIMTLKNKITFGKPESYSSGWKGKTTKLAVRRDGVVVGEIVGRENAGIAGWMEWAVELKGKRPEKAESFRAAKALALNLLLPPVPPLNPP